MMYSIQTIDAHIDAAKLRVAEANRRKMEAEKARTPARQASRFAIACSEAGRELLYWARKREDAMEAAW